MKNNFIKILLLSLVLSLLFAFTSCSILEQYGIEIPFLNGSNGGDDDELPPEKEGELTLI